MVYTETRTADNLTVSILFLPQAPPRAFRPKKKRSRSPASAIRILHLFFIVFCRLLSRPSRPVLFGMPEALLSTWKSGRGGLRSGRSGCFPPGPARETAISVHLVSSFSLQSSSFSSSTSLFSLLFSSLSSRYSSMKRSVSV